MWHEIYFGFCEAVAAKSFQCLGFRISISGFLHPPPKSDFFVTRNLVKRCNGIVSLFWVSDFYFRISPLKSDFFFEVGCDRQVGF